jgi:hypothetical protein
LTTARDPTDRLERAGHLVEMSAVTLGVLVLGWSRSRGVSFDAATRWHQALDRKGAALGGWIELVRAARTLADHPNDPMAHAVRASAIDTTTLWTSSCGSATQYPQRYAARGSAFISNATGAPSSALGAAGRFARFAWFDIGLSADSVNSEVWGNLTQGDL